MKRKRICFTELAYVFGILALALGIALSFALFGFGHFAGVKPGMVLCALVNGFLIARVGSALEAAFDFRDALKLRRLFEQ